MYSRIILHSNIFHSVYALCSGHGFFFLVRLPFLHKWFSANIIFCHSIFISSAQITPFVLCACVKKTRKKKNTVRTLISIKLDKMWTNKCSIQIELSRVESLLLWHTAQINRKCIIELKAGNGIELLIFVGTTAYNSQNIAYVQK